MTPFRRILVPIDFSRNSIQGLRYAEGFARVFGGEIIIAHVMQSPAGSTDSGLQRAAAPAPEAVRADRVVSGYSIALI